MRYIIAVMVILMLQCSEALYNQLPPRYVVNTIWYVSDYVSEYEPPKNILTFDEDLFNAVKTYGERGSLIEFKEDGYIQRYPIRLDAPMETWIQIGRIIKIENVSSPFSKYGVSYIEYVMVNKDHMRERYKGNRKLYYGK